MAKNDPPTFKKGSRIPVKPAILPVLEEFRSIKTNEGLLDNLGREKPSDRPMAPPIGFKKQPSMIENIRNMIHHELSQRAAEQGFETADEADDFDVGDDYDPHSPYEHNFEPAPPEGGDSPPPADPAPPPSPSGGKEGAGGQDGGGATSQSSSPKEAPPTPGLTPQGKA